MDKQYRGKKIESKTTSRLVELADSNPRVEDISEGDLLSFGPHPFDQELVASKKTSGEGEKTYEFITYRLDLRAVRVKEYVSNPGLRVLGNFLFEKSEKYFFPEQEEFRPVYEKLEEILEDVK